MISFRFLLSVVLKGSERNYLFASCPRLPLLFLESLESTMLVIRHLIGFKLTIYDFPKR